MSTLLLIVSIINLCVGYLTKLKMKQKDYFFPFMVKRLTITLGVLSTILFMVLAAESGVPKRPSRNTLRAQYTKVVTDPIRFTLQANKRQVHVGEEIELVITADLLNISSKEMFFLEGSNAFSLKLLIPDGFVRTDSDDTGLMEDALTIQSKPTVSYRIRGKFTTATSGICFRLLRSEFNATTRSRYIQKATLCFNYQDKAQPEIALTGKIQSANQYVLLDEATTTNVRLATSDKGYTNDITCSSPTISIIYPANNAIIGASSLPFYFDINTTACAPQGISQVQYNIIDPNGIYHYVGYVSTPGNDVNYPYAYKAAYWANEGQRSDLGQGQYQPNQYGTYTVIAKLFMQGGGAIEVSNTVTITQGTTPPAANCSGISLTANATPNPIPTGSTTNLSVSCSGCPTGGSQNLYSTSFDGDVPNSTFNTTYNEQVRVSSDSQNGNTLYCALTDHTNVGGEFLTFSGENPGTIWQNAYNVTAGVTYSFSMWVRPIFNGNTSTSQRSVDLKIGNSTIASPVFNATNASCSGGWVQIQTTWTASSTGQVSFAVVVPSQTSWQNAFSMDDLSITSNATGGTTASYTWSALEGGSSILNANSANTGVVVPGSAGTYTYRVTENTTQCYGQVQVTVNASTPPAANCSGISLTANATPNPIPTGSTTNLSVSCSGCPTGGSQNLYSTSFDGDVPNSTFNTTYNEQVRVSSDSQNGNTLYCALTDHTNVGGKFLTFSGENPGTIWQNAYNVTAGVTYSFSMWVRPIFNGNTSTSQRSVDLKIGNSTIASPVFNATNASCSGGWVQIQTTWTASSTGQVSFAVVVPSQTSWQNAFSMDDLSITSNATGGTTASYTWSALEGGSSILNANSANTGVVVPGSAGTYTYRVTENTTQCYGQVQVTVNASTPPQNTVTVRVGSKREDFNVNVVIQNRVATITDVGNTNYGSNYSTRYFVNEIYVGSTLNQKLPVNGKYVIDKLLIDNTSSDPSTTQLPIFFSDSGYGYIDANYYGSGNNVTKYQQVIDTYDPSSTSSFTDQPINGGVLLPLYDQWFIRSNSWNTEAVVSAPNPSITPTSIGKIWGGVIGYGGTNTNNIIPHTQFRVKGWNAFGYPDFNPDNDERLSEKQIIFNGTDVYNAFAITGRTFDSNSYQDGVDAANGLGQNNIRFQLDQVGEGDHYFLQNTAAYLGLYEQLGRINIARNNNVLLFGSYGQVGVRYRAPSTSFQPNGGGTRNPLSITYTRRYANQQAARTNDDGVSPDIFYAPIANTGKSLWSINMQQLINIYPTRFNEIDLVYVKMHEMDVMLKQDPTRRPVSFFWSQKEAFAQQSGETQWEHVTTNPSGRVIRTAHPICGLIAPEVLTFDSFVRGQGMFHWNNTSYRIDDANAIEDHYPSYPDNQFYLPNGSLSSFPYKSVNSQNDKKPSVPFVGYDASHIGRDKALRALQFLGTPTPDWNYLTYTLNGLRREAPADGSAITLHAKDFKPMAMLLRNPTTGKRVVWAVDPYCLPDTNQTLSVDLGDGTSINIPLMGNALHVVLLN